MGGQGNLSDGKRSRRKRPGATSSTAHNKNENDDGNNPSAPAPPLHPSSQIIEIPQHPHALSTTGHSFSSLESSTTSGSPNRSKLTSKKNTLIANGHAHLKQKQYMDAITSFQKALTVTETIHGTIHWEVVYLLTMWGDSCAAAASVSGNGAKDIQEALKHYKAALVCLDRCEGKSYVMRWDEGMTDQTSTTVESTEARSRKSKSSDHKMTAKKVFNKLKNKKSFMKSAGSSHTSSHSDRKNVMLIRDQWKLSLTAKIKTLSSSSPSTVMGTKPHLPSKEKAALVKQGKDGLNMGSLYLGNKDYTNAQTQLNKSLDARLKLVEQDDDWESISDHRLNLAATREKLGDLCVEQKKISDGMKEYNQALVIINQIITHEAKNKSFSPSDDNSSVSSAAAAAAPVMKINFQSIDKTAPPLTPLSLEQSIRDKINNLRNIHPPSIIDPIQPLHPLSSLTFSTPLPEPKRDANYKLGTAYLRKDSYSDALKCLQKSYDKTLSEQDNNPHHLKLGILHRHLGLCHYHCQNYDDEAIKHWEMAAHIAQYRNDDIYIECLEGAGRSNAQRGDEAAVMRCFAEAGVVVNRIVMSKEEKDEDKKEEILLQHIIAHTDARTILAKLARSDDNAVGHYEAALQMMRPHLSSSSSSLLANPRFEEIVMRTIKSAGVIHAHRGDYNAALELSHDMILLRTEGRWDGNCSVDDFDQRKMAEALSSLSRDQKSKTAVTLHNMAVMYEKMGGGGLQQSSSEYTDNALAYYAQSLAIKIDLYGEQSNKLAVTYNGMGYVHFLTGRDGRALSYFEKSTKLWRQALEQISTSDDDNDAKTVAVIEREYESSLNDMAVIYSRMGRQMEADACLAEIRRRNEQSRYDSTTGSLRQQGEACLRQGEYKKATEIYLKILREQKDMIKGGATGGAGDGGENFNDGIAATLRLLGTCYLFLHHDNEAFACYDKSLLASHSSSYSHDDGLIEVVTLIHMGYLQSRKKSRHQSLSCYTRARKHPVVQNNAAHDDLRMTILNLVGTSLRLLGRDEEAIVCFEEAVTLCEATRRCSRRKVCEVLRSMGLFFDGTKRNQDIDVMRAYHADNDESCRNEDLSLVLNNMGNVHFKFLRYKEAVKSYKTCLALKEKVHGAKSLPTVTTIINLGMTFFRLKKYDKALMCFERVLSVSELRGKPRRRKKGGGETTMTAVDKTVSGNGDDEHQQSIMEMTATVLNEMGNIYCCMKNYRAAELSYCKSLNIKKKLALPSSSSSPFSATTNHHQQLYEDDIFRTRHNLTLLMCREGRYYEAIRQLEDLYKMKIDRLQGEVLHPDVAKLELDMGSAYLKMKRYKNARRWLESAKKKLEVYGVDESHSYMRQLAVSLRRIPQWSIW